MFYSRVSIDKHLICAKCNSRLKTPKVLPCGELICEDCVVRNGEKCPYCESAHEIPADGLPTQRLLQELLMLKPHTTQDLNKVLVTELEQTFKELNRSIEAMKQKVDKYENDVKTHYEELKQDVDQRVSQAIRELVDFKRTSFEKFDLNKQTCLNSISEFMQKFIKESDMKFKEWNKLLHECPVITTDRIKETTISVAGFLCTLALYETNIDELIAKKADTVSLEEMERFLQRNECLLVSSSDDEDVL